MGAARVDYEEDPQRFEDKEPRVRFIVIGGNGEVQAKSEWYDNRSNAERGVKDLFDSLDLILHGVDAG